MLWIPVFMSLHLLDFNTLNVSQWHSCTIGKSIYLVWNLDKGIFPQSKKQRNSLDLLKFRVGSLGISVIVGSLGFTRGHADFLQVVVFFASQISIKSISFGFLRYKGFTAYNISKAGMSMVALGCAAEGQTIWR